MTIRTPNNSYYVSGASGGQNHTLPFGADRFEDDDLFVYVWNAGTETWDKKTVTTHYTVSSTQVSFTSSHIPSTRVIVLRKTDVDEDHPKSDFVAGASIKAQDLDNNQIQALRGIKELRDQKLSAVPSIAEDGTPSNPKMYVNLDMNGYKVINQPAGYVTSTDILDGTIVTADLANSSVTANKLASDSVTTAKIASDAVNGTKIADNSINSEHYVDGSIDTAHIADAQVTTTKIADDAVTAAKLANTAVTAGSYTATDITVDAQGRITAASSGAIGTSEITDAAVTTAKIADANVTTAKVANSAVTTAKIANDAVTVDKINDGEITVAKLNASAVVNNSEQIGSTPNDTSFFTTSASDGRYFRQDSTETITSGVSWSANDLQVATTGAIDARIIDLVEEVGGFVPIANETSFPALNPDVNNGAGTIVSVSTVVTPRTPSSGSVTIANGAGTGNTVTITGVGSQVLTAGIGMLVETTSTLHTYSFHRLSPPATNVNTVATNIANVNTVAGNTANINTVAGINSNVTTVATNNANVTAVGNDIANVNTAAGSIANINTVANDLNEATSEIDTVATNIANVNAVGTNIANVNTTVANLNSINNFADVYRVASTDPSSSLNVGDLVFNTTNNALRIYNGSAWQDGVTAAGNFMSKTGDEMTGDLSIPDKIIHSGDTNTSIRFPANDTVSVETAGSERLRITSDGKLGVGTSAPGQLLHLNSSASTAIQISDGTNNQFISSIKTAGNFANGSTAGDVLIRGQNGFAVSTNNGSSVALRIDNSGNVLVGTTDSTIYNNGDSDSEGIVLRDGEVVDIARKGDLQLTLNRQTNDGHHIGFFRSGSPKSYIATRNNGFCIDVNSSERLRIDSSGNVGIGQSNPSGKLEVSGGYVTLRNGASSYPDGISAPVIYGSTGGGSNSFDQTGNLVLQTRSDAGSYSICMVTGDTPTERLRIDSSGKTLIKGGVLELGVDDVSNGIINAPESLYFNIDCVNGSNNEAFVVATNRDTNAGGSELFRIQDGGNIGIGTSSPADKLSIHTPPNALVIGAKDTTRSNHVFQLLSNNLAGDGELRLYTNAATGTHAKTVEIKSTGSSYFNGGNVGIGTTSPQRALVVSDAGTEGFEFYPGSSSGNNTVNHYNRSTASFVNSITTADQHIFGRADGEKLRLDSSGRLLIGTSSTISVNTQNCPVQVEGTTAEASRISLINRGNHASGAGIHIAKSRGTAPALVQNNDQVGGVFFCAGDGSDFNSLSAKIECFIDGAPSGSDTPGRITFSTTPDQTDSPVERLRIDSSGNVGIGTTPNSDSQLHVKSGANDNNPILRLEGATNNFLNFRQTGSVYDINVTAGDPLSFTIGASERMRIDSSGRVCIGTTAAATTNSKLTIVNSGADCEVNLMSNPTGSSIINLGDTGDYDIGRIMYDNGANALTINTNNTERLRIDSSGNTILGYAGNSLHFQNGFNNSTSRIQNAGGSNSSNFKFLVTNSGSESEAMRIDSSGSVLIGSSAVQAHPNMDDLQLGDGSGNRGLTISSGTSGYGTIAFGDSADGSGNDRYSGSIEYYHADNSMRFYANIAERVRIDSNGHLRPATNNAYDLGTSSLRWRNVYTNDLNLSNEGSTNDVDGTWGNFTIQEGEDDLFLINRRSGKKYKFNLTEVN